MSVTSDRIVQPLIRRLKSTAEPSDEVIRALSELPFTLKSYEPGQDIIRDGDRPGHCAALVEGWLCRFKLLPGGGRQIIAFHVAGDMPDLQSLHLGVMDHSLAAVTPCTVAMIPHEALRDQTARLPDLAAVLWRETMIDAALFRGWVTAMGRRSAYGRTAHLFCELHLRQRAVGLAESRHSPMPLRQTDLADAMGLTSVHITRTLGALRRAGLITLQNRTLTIHDWDGLCAAAEFDPSYLHLGEAAG
ncbi:Crp/Fnr family transcriptional regulator [Methylobacterium sp. Leaf456]|nr:Crp/Fnr family transcriptional regulator [Methylobacterium sp. Leaf456]KQT57113.1 Crp/Fnr family transcriptional regulator [Methylobacterium sp. Leaf456]